MKCPKCNREMNNDAVFCISCGQRLVSDLPQTAKKEKNRTPLILFLGLFAIALIIGTACLLLLNPFEQNDTASYTVSTSPVSDIPQATEETHETQPPQEAPRVPVVPEGSRPLGTPKTDAVGLPTPDMEPERLQAVMKLYEAFLDENKAAQKYGLINFIGDDLPELILQEAQEDGTSCFRFYYISGESLMQLTTDKISAISDVQILSNKGSLMIMYSQEYINHIAVDQSMDTEVSFIKTSEIPDYTDSTLLVPAADRGLLELYFLGVDKKFSGNGWIRSDGTDYYYQSGKPLQHHWIEEDEFLYYLGDQACITEVASVPMISDVMNEYFASYQVAFNEKDTAYLKYATEANMAEVSKRLQEKENLYLTISDLTCEVLILYGKHKDGSVEADVRLEYVQHGEWEGAETVSTTKDYQIDLVWVDGLWYVDHIGNR